MTRRWWGVLRLALVVLWLLAAATAWWTAPGERTFAQARAAVTAGDVTAYQWGDDWDFESPSQWFDQNTLDSSGTLGPVFAWRTPDGRVQWTDTNDFDEVTKTGTVDERNYAGPGAVGLAQNLRAAGLEGRDGDLDPAGSAVVAVAVLLFAVFLGVVVAGPAPVLGTRWFWFWLVTMAPYGLGLLFWLVRDRPWTRATPAPDGPPRRDRGILGFCIGVLATILISGVLALVS